MLPREHLTLDTLASDARNVAITDRRAVNAAAARASAAVLEIVGRVDAPVATEREARRTIAVRVPDLEDFHFPTMSYRRALPVLDGRTNLPLWRFGQKEPEVGNG